MQLLVLVLNKVELLDELLSSFVKSGIKGATIIDSMGMVRALTTGDNKDIPFFGSLKFILNGEHPFNKTIFVVLNDEQLSTCVGCVREVIGDLNKPDVGILFTVPVNHYEGITTAEIQQESKTGLKRKDSER